MFRSTGHLFVLAIAFVFAMNAMVPAVNAQAYSTSAKQAVLMDADTGTVLFSKEADAPFPPASLAKIMTMEVVFNALQEDRLKLTDKFFVSEYAWRTGGATSGGSTMFAEVNSEIELENLIRGIIIQSANDGCIIIAEGMAGSEAGFAGLMNERARKIGLKNSRFVNSTGLPAEGQHVSANDLAKLAQHMIRQYPEYYRYYSEREFTWNDITQRNRNPLLAMGVGADGMKTGYTEASGYAIVGTVKRPKQRLIAALGGMSSSNERKEEARKIIDWGSRAFEKIRLFEEGEIIGEADVYGGAKGGVELVGNGAVDIYLPVGFRDRLRARISYTGPILPPVSEGDQIAVLKVWIGDTLSQETPLYAHETVGQGKLHQRSLDALKELAIGWIPL